MPISQSSVDATIRHQAMLEGLKRNHEQIVLPYLQKLDKKLRLKLTRAELTTYNRKRLEALIASVGEMTNNILSGATAELTRELGALAKAEAAFESASLDNAVQNVAFNAKTPAAAQVRAAINAAPLAVSGVSGGQLLKPFMKGWTKAQTDMVQGAIRNGAFTGATNATILKTIRGTASAKFKDGLLGRSAAQFRAVVHTAVQHVSSVARMETYAANSDLVKMYRWSSTLDNKTTEICQSLDGQEFPVGGGPVPPAHVNCRSSTVPVLDEEFKFLREGATRSSQFGPVPANQTYYDWLGKQPAAFQDGVLGKSLGKVFRQGGLTSEQFAKMRMDQKTFKVLTLGEMRKLQPLAFNRAGVYLNPNTGRPKTPNAFKPAKPAPKKAPTTKPKYVEPVENFTSSLNQPVTMKRIQDVLAGIPGAQKEVAKVNQFLGKYRTGSLFGLEADSSKYGQAYVKKGMHARISKYVDENLGPAPDGSRSLYFRVVAKPRAGGFTHHSWNFVVVRVKKKFANFANINPAKLPENIRETLSEFAKTRRQDSFTFSWDSRLRFKRKSALSAGEDAEIFLNWVHEIGHQIHFRAGAPSRPWRVGVEIEKAIPAVTEYSTVNRHEWFAEHFVAWLVDREALYKLSPDCVKFIDDVVEKALNNPVIYKGF